MTKKEAFRELHAVLRETPASLARIESGPAPLTPLAQYLNSVSPSTSTGSSAASQIASLIGATVGGGGAGSILGEALGGGQNAQSSGWLGVLGGGLSPVVTGLMSLFGPGSKSAPPPLNLYSAPQRINQTASMQGGVVSSGDFNQYGIPRAGSNAPQVTLHIQAMDSQSILNRSADIATAVRQAMLHSHPINDVVADL